MILRPRPFAAALVAATVAAGAGPAAGQPGLIFADGFESGDVSMWSRAFGVAAPSTCATGLALSGTFEGDLGTAPGGGTEIGCLEMRNDQATTREGEVAFSSLPLPATLGLLDADELLLVGPGGQRVAAQFDVVSRWGGTVDDSSLPIRWLQVTTPARVAAMGATTYALRRVPGLAAAADPFAVDVTDQGGGVFAVDTGVATFTVDAASPALLTGVAIDTDDDGVGRTAVYSHTAGAGPHLVFATTGGDVTLSTATPGAVSVDAGSFSIVEQGPVKAVVKLSGHFADPGGESLCDVLGAGLEYERFGYTVAMTFTRGRRDVGIQVELRNECSDANFEPWTDDGVTVHRFSWELPLGLASPVAYLAGGGAVVAEPAGFSGTAIVEQRLGADSGGGWTRRARARFGAGAPTDGEAFASPLAAVAGSGLLAAAQVPWMRYREPQALAADEATLSLRFVSDTIVLGEGKGVWNLAKVHLVPTGLVTGGTTTFLETLRERGRMELERGLLVHPSRELTNAAGIYPSVGTDATSTLKTNYLAWMDTLHDELTGPGGAWEAAKIFGSQLWPESGASDPFGVGADTPDESSAAMNYWDPAGIELFEFLRSGDPKWVWDYALMAYWTQVHTAYMNIGDRQHGNRGGGAVQSGGPGCAGFAFPCTATGSGGGQWHRSAFGSDDYTYAMTADLAYAVRPNPLLRDRFAQAGWNFDARYDVPRAQEATRECFVNEVDVSRQVIQHFEMLANCAELVPGTRGAACHAKLQALLDELAEDNLDAGLLCQRNESSCFGTAPPAATECFAPQQFMTNALMYPFFHRMYRNYGDPPGGSIAAMLVTLPRTLYELGMPKLAGGVAVDPGPGAACDEGDGDGCWWSGMSCTLSADQSTVLGCAAAEDSDGNFAMYAYNRPHTLALVLMSHEIEPHPTVDLCTVARAVYDDPDFTGLPDAPGGNWSSVGHFVPVGWWKGTAQMMQSMVFAVGLYDTCD